MPSSSRAIAESTRTKREYYDLYLLLEDLIEFDERFLLWRGRHVRMVERMIGQKPGTGGSSGAQYLEGTLGYRFFPELWEVRTLSRRRKVRMSETLAPPRRARTMARAVSDSRKLDVSRQPFDGRRAAGRARARSKPIGTSGRPTVRRRGSAGCRASARSPTASARSSVRPPGACFFGPNVSVLQAAIATCIDFGGERNEVVYEALQFPSLTYVWREWERYGAVVRIVASDDGRTIPTERIVEAITEKTAIAVLSHAYYVSGAIADVRSDSSALPQRRRAALRRRLSDDRRLSVRRHRMGSRSRDRRLAQVALRRTGLRLDLSASRRCSRSFARPSPDGWRTRARSRSSRRRSCTLHRCTASATARRRFRATSSRSPATRSLHRSASRAFANTTFASPRRSPRWRSNAACASTRRSNRSGEPAGSASTSTVPSSACRRLIERRVFVDYRPGCGIRVGPHFYTTDDEIDDFFRVLDTKR